MILGHVDTCERTMSICRCGFDFVKARLRGRRLESYAVIRDSDYESVVRKECAILSKRKLQDKLKLIAEAATWVGILERCPECGGWLLLKPQRGKKSPQAVSLKTADRRK
jgi:hypothetical protein